MSTLTLPKLGELAEDPRCASIIRLIHTAQCEKHYINGLYGGHKRQSADHYKMYKSRKRRFVELCTKINDFLTQNNIKI
jgi:hypothetical protein